MKISYEKFSEWEQKFMSSGSKSTFGRAFMKQHFPNVDDHRLFNIQNRAVARQFVLNNYVENENENGNRKTGV
jgi:hypothetical protein